MKDKDKILERKRKIEGRLDCEDNPLNYIYGLAQLRILKWILEEA